MDDLEVPPFMETPNYVVTCYDSFDGLGTNTHTHKMCLASEPPGTEPEVTERPHGLLFERDSGRLTIWKYEFFCSLWDVPKRQIEQGRKGQ